MCWAVWLGVVDLARVFTPNGSARASSQPGLQTTALLQSAAKLGVRAVLTRELASKRARMVATAEAAAARAQAAWTA